MKDNEYFFEKELTDFQKLQIFNERTNLFKELIDMSDELTYFDCSACTFTNKGARIELKSREYNTFHFQNLFIEDTKLNIIIDYFVYNDEPLYINFMADGNTVIHNLTRFSKRPEYQKKRAYSKGYNSWEYQAKNGLWLTDAWIYDKDGKLIQKPIVKT